MSHRCRESAANQDLVADLVAATVSVEVGGPVPRSERNDTQGERTSRRVDKMAGNPGTEETL